MRVINKFLVTALILSVCSCSSGNSVQPLNQAVTASNTTVTKNLLNHKKNTAVSNLPANLNPQTKKVTDAIAKVSSGVELISESDYEFSISVWQNQAATKFTTQKLLETLKLNKKLKCEEQKETIQSLLGDYATKKYWEGSGYSEKEITEKIAKYKAFIKQASADLKNVQIFYVDDPQNLEDSYDPSGDFSGEVGVYVLGRVGNDIVVLKSAYVWT